MSSPFVWLAIFVALLYAYATVKLLVKQRVPVHQHYAPWDGGEPPISNDTRTALDAAVASLVAAGFQRHGYITHTRPDQASAIGEVLDRPDGSAAAAVFAVVKGARPRRPSILTTITTEFSDGTRLGVTNSVLNYPMRRNPRAIAYRFPFIKDAARLFKLQRTLVERHGGTITPRTTGGDAAAFFAARVDEEWERQRSLGIVTVSDGMYRPTLMGALLMAWRLVPPSSTAIRFIAIYKGDKLAQELGVGDVRR